jgi:hypothetical protein
MNRSPSIGLREPLQAKALGALLGHPLDPADEALRADEPVLHLLAALWTVIRTLVTGMERELIQISSLE